MFLVLLGGQVLAEEPIKMAEPDWPGIWAKNAVVSNILEDIGYQLETISVNDVIAHNSLGSGDIDVHLGSWMPSAEPIRENVDGDFEVVRKNLNEGLYTLGVPEYVWEAGVKSFADLDQHADKFDKKLYLGPVGWTFSDKIEEAIEEDIYGLGDWEIVNSSQTAMLTNMKRAWDNQEWIVSLAWTPHWMNHIMDIKYLEDPKGVWLNAESWVDTLVRAGFQEDHPQVYRFLQQFEVTNDMSNQWIYEIGYEEKDPETVAQNWVKNNMETVEDWLEGVSTPEGKKAVEVIKNK